MKDPSPRIAKVKCFDHTGHHRNGIVAPPAVGSFGMNIMKIGA